MISSLLGIPLTCGIYVHIPVLSENLGVLGQTDKQIHAIIFDQFINHYNTFLSGCGFDKFFMRP